MLRILVVEDEQPKKQLITQALCKHKSCGLENLSFADNVRDAKHLLTRLRFDLVVLDINIPRAADSAPEVGAGLDILSFVRNNLKAIAPGYIFGLTAYEDGFSFAADDFTSALWKLARFSYSDDGWQRALASAVEYLVQRELPPHVTDGSTHHVQVGVVTALQEELQTLLAVNCEWREVIVAHDFAKYHSGSLATGEDHISFVATAAPRMGLTSMAISATKLISAFHPRILASVGICAGVRGKTQIGDILVADPCFDWGSGKWSRDQEGRLKFLPAPYQWRLDARIARTALEIAKDLDFLTGMHEAFEGPKPPDSPRVFVDAMASGASVLQVQEMMSSVRDQHKNLIGVEMETYALFASAEYASEPRPICVAAKSVCDFGDDEKNDDHHEYASYTSTQFLLQLIRRVAPLQ